MNQIREAGHDYVHDQNEPGRLLAKAIATLVWTAVCLLILFACGCHLPPGTHAQTTGVGIDFSPLGDSPESPKLRLGSFATQFATPVPADAGASFNRSDLHAPFGIRQTATEGLGALGREFKEGGQPLVEVIDRLHPINVPNPFPMPPAPP